jgi:hypothetical protein
MIEIGTSHMGQIAECENRKAANFRTIAVLGNLCRFRTPTSATRWEGVLRQTFAAFTSRPVWLRQAAAWSMHVGGRGYCLVQQCRHDLTGYAMRSSSSFLLPVSSRCIEPARFMALQRRDYGENCEVRDREDEGDIIIAEAYRQSDDPNVP